MSEKDYSISDKIMPTPENNMKHLIRELRYWKQDTLKHIGDWLEGKEDTLWYWSTIPAACLGWGAAFGFIAWLIIPAFTVWVAGLTSVAAYWLYKEQSR